MNARTPGDLRLDHRLSDQYSTILLPAVRVYDNGKVKKYLDKELINAPLLG